MVTVIKKGSSAKEVLETYRKHTEDQKKKNLRKYCDVLSLKKDPVKLQNDWRNEWE